MRERGASKGTVRRLRSFYFDTSDQFLRRAGLTLRVRQSGKQFVQTLKFEATDNPLVRRQWETPVKTMAPDVERLPHLEIGQATGSLRVDDLLPIFSTKFRRQIYMVRTADAVVEVAFDDGSIEAGDQTEPLSEVELELREGDLASLYDLGLLMVAGGPSPPRNAEQVGTRLCPRFRRGPLSSQGTSDRPRA